ncbi:squalene synthase HpnC [Cerasicoccus frondis]|uniref:squalene synthase HpnC n=1 Tax=Cerasicoccus frondis TaxID=490090 RepID=UPI002852548E|nr:squalene synthase HpnC [Cerasicoccus frondis]
MTVKESYNRCFELTRTHYENFPVARLAPKRIRPYVAAVYAFARYADDLADEGWGEPGAPTPEERVEQLDAYENELLAALEGKPLKRETEWIFVAVADTIQRTGAPPELFTDLLSAFKQDCVQLRYESFIDVLDYCRRSANPVGRLVLILHNHIDEQLFEWSDNICTGLQLANFWQDVGVDIRKDGRIYIPEEDWAEYDVTEDMFQQATTPPELRECIKFQVEKAGVLFAEGKPLASELPFPLSLEIRLTWLGGVTILKKIKQLEYNTLELRPKIRNADKFSILARSCLPL